MTEEQFKKAEAIQKEIDELKQQEQLFNPTSGFVLNKVLVNVYFPAGGNIDFGCIGKNMDKKTHTKWLNDTFAGHVDVMLKNIWLKIQERISDLEKDFELL